MDIGWAVESLKQGLRVSRQGWNGKGMWLALQEPVPENPMMNPYVYMKAADGKIVVWLCSQTDLLAEDWELAVPPA